MSILRPRCHFRRPKSGRNFVSSFARLLTIILTPGGSVSRTSPSEHEAAGETSITWQRLMNSRPKCHYLSKMNRQVFTSLLQHSSLPRFQCISNICPAYYQALQINQHRHQKRKAVAATTLPTPRREGMSSGVGLLRHKRSHYRKAGVLAGPAAGGRVYPTEP